MTSFAGTLAPLLDFARDVPTWRDEAICRGRWETFLDEARTAEAVDICQTCPVIEECLADALTRFDPWVQGGKTWTQRKRIKAKQRIGPYNVRGRCVVCDAVFYAGAPAAKFCSTLCRKTSHRRRWREAKQAARTA